MRRSRGNSVIIIGKDRDIFSSQEYKKMIIDTANTFCELNRLDFTEVNIKSFFFEKEDSPINFVGTIIGPKAHFNLEKPTYKKFLEIVMHMHINWDSFEEKYLNRVPKYKYNFGILPQDVMCYLFKYYSVRSWKLTDEISRRLQSDVFSVGIPRYTSKVLYEVVNQIDSEEELISIEI